MKRPKTLKKITPWAAFCLFLWKLLVKTRAGYRCEICGCTTKQLHAHHLIDAGVLCYRYEPMNGICLCASCHKLDKHRAAHRNPMVWFEDSFRVEVGDDRWGWFFNHWRTGPAQDLLKPKLKDYPGIADGLEAELEKLK